VGDDVLDHPPSAQRSLRPLRVAKAGEIVGEGGALGVGSRPQSRTRQDIGHTGLRWLDWTDNVWTTRERRNNRSVSTGLFLLRPDGIGQVHTRERIIRGDGVASSLQFMGYVVPPIAMPALSVLLSPDFQWPDIDLPMHGATFVEAASEEWSAATATVYGASSGAVNLAARTLRLEATSLAPTSAGRGVDGRDTASGESAGRPADTNSRC
jgi:hypothetical protein